MPRESYIYKDGQLVPKPAEYKAKSHHVIFDDVPEGIQHPVTGEVFTSKKKFRERTRSLGYEECYGEPDSSWEKPKTDNLQEIEEDVEKAVNLLEYGESLTEDERELCRLRDQIMDWKAEQ